MTEDVPVTAFLFGSGEWVGDYPSVSKAARTLFIRYPGTIYFSIFGTKGSTHKGTKKGIKSYKDGRKFSFEKQKSIVN